MLNWYDALRRRINNGQMRHEDHLFDAGNASRLKLPPGEKNQDAAGCARTIGRAPPNIRRGIA